MCNVAGGNSGSPSVGNSIFVGTGKKYQKETDYVSTGDRDFVLARQYSSLGDLPPGYARVGIFGAGWLSTYERRIDTGASVLSTTKTAQRPNGHRYYFNNVGGDWVSNSNVHEALQQTANGWSYTTKQDVVENYDVNGVLQSLVYPDERVHTLDYDAQGRLSDVYTTTGESLTFTYLGGASYDLVSKVTDHASRKWKYSYDTTLNNLEFVIYPDGTSGDSDNPVREYHYENSDYPYGLTGITDERGIRYSTYAYDSTGKASASYHGPQTPVLTDRINGVSVTYNADGSRVVTNSKGTDSIYSMTTQSGVALVTEIAGPGCLSCGAGDTTFDYDPDTNNLNSKTNNNIITAYGNYDPNGNPGYMIEASGTSQARRTDYEYHGTFVNKITKILEPSVFASDPTIQCAPFVDCKDTTYTYDAFGNRISETISGFTPNGVSVSRTTNYQFNGPFNQLSQIDGPRLPADASDITTIHYYSATHNDVTKQARVKEVEDATGALIRDTIQYTATGKVESEVRPNGLSLSYAYYPGNDRLKKLTETSVDGTYITRWDYLATGEVSKISMAHGTTDATTLDFGYDNARRLTKITDGMGSYIEYTLDTEGNREGEDTYDSAGVLKKTLTQTFDVYNRLDVSTQVNETQDSDFDPDGTLGQQTDGEGHVTDYSYDSLKRLLSSTQDLGGLGALTQYAYDADDRLTQVTDPNNGTTTYQYDDLGNLLATTSPDTGTTVFAYDGAGNVITRLDALGQTMTYTYDALNRLINVVAPDTADDISYTYDSCSNGSGQLCSVTAGTTSVTYTYDGFGNVTSHQQLSYIYDDAHRVKKVTYPTGTTVRYVYDAAGQVSQVDLIANGSTTILASNISYAPFGSVSALDYDNGAVLSQDYDTAYRLTSQQVSGALDLVYPFYDANGNLINRTDTFSSAANFSYDGLDRLDLASGTFGSRDYDYDLNGNRTQLDDGAVTGYSYEAQSNRLDQIGSAGVILDVAGNTLSKGSWSYSYTAHHRLKTANDNGQLIASYAYNGLGQRVAKDVGGTITQYFYGLNGELLAEIGATGLKREYIYLNGQLLAVRVSESVGNNPIEIIMDNGDAGTSITGEWNTKTATTDYGDDYLRSANNSVVSKYDWTPTLTAGTYDVYAWWSSNSGNSTNAPYIIKHNGTSDTVYKDQTSYSNGWALLGTYVFDGISTERVRIKDSNGKVHADAVRFVRTDTTTDLYYVHNDHLGTPQVMTDESGSVAWRATYDPFGEATVDVASTAALNVRFPGQYFDVETELHYNYFRYYDPETGRYITSDPIGLEGGLNTYGYVEGNPMYWSDPLGLAITPVGTPAEIAAINNALNKLSESNPATKAAIDALRESSNNHSIRFPLPDERPVNKTTGIRDNEKNGIGTGSETICDVTKSVTVGGLELSGKSILAHELLGHGGDKDRGAIDRSRNPLTGQKRHEESAMDAANKYRKSVGESLRTKY